MPPRFLVDECLSPALTRLAQDAGCEAIAVAHHGLMGVPDHRVMEFAETGGYCIVTNNRDDFLALLQVRELHPGLVVLKGAGGLDLRHRQFGVALAAMRGWGDSINKVVEVGVDLTVAVYDLPPVT